MLYWPKASFRFFKYLTHLQDSVKTFSHGEELLLQSCEWKDGFYKITVSQTELPFFFFFFLQIATFLFFCLLESNFSSCKHELYNINSFYTAFFRRKELARAGTLLGADYAQKECTEVGDESPCVTERLRVGSGASASQVVETGARSWDPWRIRK